MRQQPQPIQIVPFQAPQHETRTRSRFPRPLPVRRAEPGKNGGNEPGGSGAVFLIGPGAQYFVQCAERQPAAGQRAIDRGNPKGNDTVNLRRLDPAKMGAKSVEAGNVSRLEHAQETVLTNACSYFVPKCISLVNPVLFLR